MWKTRCGQLALRRLLLAPEHASGCLSLWPVIRLGRACLPPRACFSSQAAATLSVTWAYIVRYTVAYEGPNLFDDAYKDVLAPPHFGTSAQLLTWVVVPAYADTSCLGSAPARLLCLLRARLAALGSAALPGRRRPTGRPATASGARAIRLQSRRSAPPLTMQVAAAWARDASPV